MKEIDGFSQRLRYMVADRVSILRKRFYEDYETQPKYLKISVELFSALKEERESILPEISGIPMFMGLQLCPTVKVQSIYDIEVF